MYGLSSLRNNSLVFRPCGNERMVEVAALGRRLQVLNLLAGPALAALLGLAYFLSRRRLPN